MNENNAEQPPEKNGYNEEGVVSSRVLKGLEAVRERPGMYVGDTGVKGLHHLFKEILDNAINEVMAGHCTVIKVVHGADSSLSVEDNGRGIPVTVYADTGKTVVELVFTELHAGSIPRFDGPKVFSGLHGVGPSCVNALSTWLECEVRRDGSIYRQRFERGVPVTPLTVVGTCGKAEQGTKVTWLADDTMFGPALDANGRLRYEPERLRDYLRKTTFLNPIVSISFCDAYHGTAPEAFQYPRGVADYVAYLNAAKQAVHPQVISFSKEHDGTFVDVALQYHRGAEETILTFANNVDTSDGGTHLTGFKTALTRVINRYARKNGFINDTDTNFAGAAVRDGLTAVVAVRLPNPRFESSTKARLDSPEVEGIVNHVVGAGLSAFLEANPQAAHAIMNRVMTSARLREVARQTAPAKWQPA